MAKLYLFTWNLKHKESAHEHLVRHLSARGQEDLFVACVQELPGESLIARARRSLQAELTDVGISVVPASKSMVPGLALAHHPDMDLNWSHWDEDGEFVAAIFQLPSSKKQVAVVGLHAKSKVDMQDLADRGGSRALLRQAINEHRLQRRADHLVVLGDFNSAIDDREIRSWHCFYALGRRDRPLGFESRRGVPHPPLYVVRPRNEDDQGTFKYPDSGVDQRPIVDFMVVDEGTREQTSTRILTEISGRPVWDPAGLLPALSDHQPVDGLIEI
ncbi:MAG: hypothetical protein Q8S73_01875 [Deltaproteobacteria bacterium]|nr:hypothetical protein [Myxococcales bacterium]MDP3212824.1 hypothetical protein [Deltaproteobacteria bacterium]